MRSLLAECCFSVRRPLARALACIGAHAEGRRTRARARPPPHARTHARTFARTHTDQTHTGARTRSSFPLHSVRRTVGAPFHHGLLEAVVTIPSRVASTEVHVLVTHLNPHSSEKRGRESEYLAARVLELSARGVAVLVLGDLNTLSPWDDAAYVHSVYAFMFSTHAFTRTHTHTHTHTRTHARTHKHTHTHAHTNTHTQCNTL